VQEKVSVFFFFLMVNVADVRLAVCRLEMFERMEEVIRHYPTPESLRTKLLTHLYSEGGRMGGSAVAFVASRYLPPGVGGRALVDGLKAANEEMLSQVMQNRTDAEMHAAYIRFVEKWCDTPIDATLVGDVLASISRANRRLPTEGLPGCRPNRGEHKGVRRGDTWCCGP
jgi:hypothetical protein